MALLLRGAPDLLSKAPRSRSTNPHASTPSALADFVTRCRRIGWALTIRFLIAKLLGRFNKPRHSFFQLLAGQVAIQEVIAFEEHKCTADRALGPMEALGRVLCHFPLEKGKRAPRGGGGAGIPTAAIFFLL